MTEGEIEVRRLGWAGVELRVGDECLVIDLLEDPSVLEPFVGEPRTPLPGPSAPGEAAGALVTHLHSDHTDPAALARALRSDGRVLRPEESSGDELEAAGVAIAEAGLAECGLAQVRLGPWDETEVGPFTVTAVPAVDGFGDPQVSWVVEAKGTRIFHGGDTIFHGWWWSIAMRCGPIDIAFLPVNGPTVSLPHRQPPNPLVSALDAEQAAIAAQLLRARLAIPMHFDTFERAPTYVQGERPAERFLEAAGRLDVPAAVVGAGEPVGGLVARA
jgi:L-ascorbate metabolism protein UlaG (beta-lactamase superfamily)